MISSYVVYCLRKALMSPPGAAGVLKMIIRTEKNDEEIGKEL